MPAMRSSRAGEKSNSICIERNRKRSTWHVMAALRAARGEKWPSIVGGLVHREIAAAYFSTALSG